MRPAGYQPPPTPPRRFTGPTPVPKTITATITRIRALLTGLTDPTRNEHGELITPKLEIAYAGITAAAADGYPTGSDQSGHSSDIADPTHAAAASRGRHDHAEIERHLTSALRSLRDAEEIVGRYVRLAPAAAAAQYAALRCRDRLGGGVEPWADPTCTRLAVHSESGLCHACYMRKRRWEADQAGAA